MQIIKQFVHCKRGKSKTWERGVGRLCHIFVPVSKVSPGHPWQCSRAGFWSWALPGAALCSSPRVSSQFAFYIEEPEHLACSHLPTSGKTSIEMVSKELCWKLPQQLLVQSRTGCYSSHKSSPCWETSLAFWVLNWATFGVCTRLCKFCLC